MNDSTVTFRGLSSGWVRIEDGHTWCQVPYWPCGEAEIEAGTWKPRWHREFVARLVCIAEEAS